MTRRREATPAEFRALANPLRLRILRLCLHDPLTNKQIADELDRDPATVLHHVRLLVETGFLAPDTPRTGRRGALEKPYRATGKSWQLSAERFPADQKLARTLAMVDAFRAELAQAGGERELLISRLGLKLDEESAQELRQRLEEVVEEFAARPEAPRGERFGLFVGLHPRR